jgi:hypothetical protein
MGVLEDVSANGAKLLLNKPLIPGTRVRYDVPGTPLRKAGTVVFSRATSSAMDIQRYTIGVQTGVETSWMESAWAFWTQAESSPKMIPARTQTS